RAKPDEAHNGKARGSDRMARTIARRAGPSANTCPDPPNAERGSKTCRQHGPETSAYSSSLECGGSTPLSFFSKARWYVSQQVLVLECGGSTPLSYFLSFGDATALAKERKRCQATALQSAFFLLTTQ